MCVINFRQTPATFAILHVPASQSTQTNDEVTEAATVAEINQGISTGNFIKNFLWMVNLNVIIVYFQQKKVLG